MPSPWPALSLIALTTVAAPGLHAAQNPRTANVERGLLPRTPIVGDPAWTLAERLAHHQVPGVSVAVLQDFRIAWAKGYGLADVAAKRPVGPRTRFQAGSISKPVAALGAMKLVEQGKLSLDAGINGQLKRWQLPGNDLTAKTPVTLRMLLSHSGGLTVHGFPGYALDQPVPGIPDILDGKPPANTPPVRVDLAPDTQTRYSGGGITLEQLAMTDATGENFPALLDRLVLRPLGMADSTYAQPDGDDPSLPTGYRPDRTPVKGRYHRYPEMAAAGLWSTPTDLLKAALEMPAALKGRGRVLSAASARQMLTPRFAASPDGEASIGLGWFVERHGGHTYFGHNGADEGFQCVMVVNPQTGQGAAVMTNSDNGVELAMEIVRAVAAEYRWPGFLTPLPAVALDPGRAARLAGRYRLDGDTVLRLREKDGKLWLQDHGDVELRPLSQNLFVRTDADLRYRLEDDRLIELDHGKETPAPRLNGDAKVPSELLQEGRIEAALAAYRALHAAQPSDPGLDEGRLNRRGYDHLRRREFPQALALFTLNTELHPDSSNPWDSLGEACLAAGEKGRARAAYRKLLEVLPGDKATPLGLKENLRANASAALAQLDKEP